MTANDYSAGERWVAQGLPFLVIITIVLITVAGIVLSHKRNKWVYGFLGLVICWTIGSVVFISHQQSRFKTYVAQSKLVTANLRPYQYSLIGLRPASGTDVALYSKYNNYKSILKLKMYTSKKVTGKARYLGNYEGDNYFMYDVYKIPIRYNGPIEFMNVDHAYLEGYAFTVSNQGYRDIGFQDPSYQYPVRLVVPKSQQKLVAPAELFTSSKTLQKAGIPWTMEPVS